MRSASLTHVSVTDISTLFYADYLIRSRVSRSKHAPVRGMSSMDFGNGMFALCFIVNGVEAMNSNAVNADDNFCSVIKNKIGFVQA
jgi:hypothetical protein